MDKDTFQQLLKEEVSTYQDLLETQSGDWIVKGVIDTNKRIYAMTSDTKVVSKIIEIILVPKLYAFASRHGLILELPSEQNYYPDLTFKDREGTLFAVDFKSSYYRGCRVNGLTLGSYWGYFRAREQRKNTDYPYSQYACHLILGMLYQQRPIGEKEWYMYTLDELDDIPSAIGDFRLFVQPKWKIASDKVGSGNTRNIGGITDVDKLVCGEGPFSSLGEDVFDHYWMNFYNSADARIAGIERPKYHNLETYQAYLAQEQEILDKLVR